MQVDQLSDKIGVGAARLHVQGYPDFTGNGHILGQQLSAVDQAVIGQRLNWALVARSGIDQHVASTQGRDRPAWIINIAKGCTTWPVCGEPAVAPQKEPLRPAIWQRPAAE